MRRTYALILALSAILVGACRDRDCPTNSVDTVVVQDKQIRLMFPAVGLTAERNWNMMPAYAHLQRFDKRNYPGVDSAVMSVCFITFPGNTGEAELYDVTTGRSIGGSTLITSPVPDSLEYLQECKVSGNIWDSLSTGEHDLAIRMRGTEKGNSTPTGIFTSVLYLYRK